MDGDAFTHAHDAVSARRHRGTRPAPSSTMTWVPTPPTRWAKPPRRIAKVSSVTHSPPRSPPTNTSTPSEPRKPSSPTLVATQCRAGPQIDPGHAPKGPLPPLSSELRVLALGALDRLLATNSVREASREGYRHAQCPPRGAAFAVAPAPEEHLIRRHSGPQPRTVPEATNRPREMITAARGNRMQIRRRSAGHTHS